MITDYHAKYFAHELTRRCAPDSAEWRWSKETLQEKIATGEIRFTADGKGIRRRTYLREQTGLPPSSLCRLATTDRPSSSRSGYFRIGGKQNGLGRPNPKSCLSAC